MALYYRAEAGATATHALQWPVLDYECAPIFHASKIGLLKFLQYKGVAKTYLFKGIKGSFVTNS